MRAPTGHIFECKKCKKEVYQEHFTKCFNLTPREVVDFIWYTNDCDKKVAELNDSTIQRLRETRKLNQTIIGIRDRKERLRWKAEVDDANRRIQKRAALRPSTIH